MNALDAAGPIPGYYNSPFPGEDGGPRRQLMPRGSTLGLGDGERLCVTSRPAVMANMVVLRDRGEVFVQGNSPPTSGDTHAWVERIDPVTLAPLARSPELPGGPFWAGGILVHVNGDLYVTYGRYCHRLDAGCALVASRQLPRERPYNSLLALSDGNLVMKSFVRDGSEKSYFSVLEPDGLAPVCPEIEIPEGSIARISRDITQDGEFVYVIGDHTAFRYRYDRGALTGDRSWSYMYRTLPNGEQSYGWDPVIADGSAWFMDNGDNQYQRTLVGTGLATGPLHVHRVSTDEGNDADVFTPFGLTRGTIVNPPLIDASRKIVVAYDSGNGRIGGFRYGRDEYVPLWEHAFNASCHFLLYPASGEVVANDYQDSVEHMVVLDIESGREKARIATGSPVQAVLFQSPGWDRDIYTCTFTTLSRTFVA